jgi:hypothetical protein
MPPAGSEPTIPASKPPQIHTFDRAATRSAECTFTTSEMTLFTALKNPRQWPLLLVNGDRVWSQCRALEGKWI